MKRAVIYARYSCSHQTEQSIEGQLTVCNSYAEREGFTIVSTYIDRAMTGRNDFRPDFQRMIKDSANHTFDYVLVYKLDRFARNNYDHVINKKKLKDNGVTLVSACENISDSPDGILLESIYTGLNQYYSAELSEKVKRGNAESRKKGFYTGGYLLYGYKVIDKKYQIKYRLYQLEEMEINKSFIKINQSCYANIKRIKKFDSTISGALKVIFNNGYVDYIARRELKNFKERMGL